MNSDKAVWKIFYVFSAFQLIGDFPFWYILSLCLLNHNILLLHFLSASSAYRIKNSNMRMTLT